jgi:hypothetical protein
VFVVLYNTNVTIGGTYCKMGMFYMRQSSVPTYIRSTLDVTLRDGKQSTGGGEYKIIFHLLPSLVKSYSGTHSNAPSVKVSVQKKTRSA